jgi:LacI family transcriptional regulator
MSAPPEGKPSAARRTTLKDVAALSGVSPMTVSNVINGRMKGYNAETRDRVLTAAKRMNYRPDIAARSLRTDRRNAVGMLVVHDTSAFLTDPYIHTLLDGLCAGLNQHGYSMVLHGLSANEVGSAPLVRQRHGDGLCILMAGAFRAESRLAETLLSLGQPVVLFQQSVAEVPDDVCVLRQDDFDGGYRLCRHLIERGARRIAVVMPRPEWLAMNARLEGVRAAVSDSDTSTEIDLVTAIDETSVATQAALSGYLAEGHHFDAVIAGNDQMAIAVYRMLKARGIRVPADVRLTGFNGFSLHDHFEAKLTTMRSPAFEIGMLGALYLVRRIESGSFAVRSVLLPVDFVPGETT